MLWFLDEYKIQTFKITWFRRSKWGAQPRNIDYIILSAQEEEAKASGFALNTKPMLKM